MVLLLLSGSPIVIPLIKESAQAQKNKAASTAMQDVQDVQQQDMQIRLLSLVR